MPEELIVRYCAPTLAGMKTGSMFSCTYGSLQQLCQDVREMNLRLGGKGLRVIPLRYQKGRALIYFYRPKQLAQDLLREEAAQLLADRGYPVDSWKRCVVQLVTRLQGGEGFPHEIGLFLGYPIQDVRGFMENRATNCKCVGCWKVYGDEEVAKKLFRKYHRCTEVYCNCLQRGFSMERLTVAA